MSNDDYTAGDSVLVTLVFSDPTGAPMTPTTLEYQLDDVTSMTNILPLTSITPTGPTQTIVVTPEQNQLVSGRPVEVHQLSAVATDATGDARWTTVCWEVKALISTCGDGC